MHKTRANAKAEADPLLDDEFLRCFCTEPEEAVQWAFRQWRERSPFWPAISDIRELVKEWRRRAAEQEQVEAQESERQQLAQARAEGRLVDPADINRMLVEIANKAAMNGHRQPRSEELRPRVLVNHTADEWEARRLEAKSKLQQVMARAQDEGRTSEAGAQ